MKTFFSGLNLKYQGNQKQASLLSAYFFMT
jgi:hypothetical protein